MRTLSYARYSSDKQSAASIVDQLRNCRAFAQRQGWPAPIEFTDAAMSGARKDRPDYQRLLSEARAGDVILVDDLSRLSRDSIETAQAIRGLTFRGVRIIGISDSLDTSRKDSKINAGLRGLMSELYLDDLREKTHRGLTGRALSGASAGGLPFGYRVTETGQRAIHEAQAAVVVRIFTLAAQGRSARQIAHQLNAEGVPSPRGGTWAQSAIYGDMKRGIGILANPIYIGEQVWNRSRFVKHPETGRRVRQERPRGEWIIRHHPELAIVDRALWDLVHRREQKSMPGKKPRAPKNLLSGILRCAQCGGPMVVVDAYNYGCAAAKDRGTCTSRVLVRRKIAERILLEEARSELTEEKFRRFQLKCSAELKRRAPDADTAKRALTSAEKERENIMAAIRAGIITPSTREGLQAAEAAVDSAQRALRDAQSVQPARMLPQARAVWDRLSATLNDQARHMPELREALRQTLGKTIRVLKNENGDPIAEVAGFADENGSGGVLRALSAEPRQVLLLKKRG